MNRKVSVGLSEKNASAPVALNTLEEAARTAFEVTGMQGGEISVVACDDLFIAGLNRAYRGKNSATDVLSFPMQSKADGEDSEGMLGDIIISVQTTEVQARTLKSTVQEEFIFLFIHGLLHLLGFTHDKPQEEKKMMDTAREIQLAIKGTT
jgi:probable rRNA maturation factor